MKAELMVQGIQFSVDYDYQPGEAETLNYPGCKESAGIESVYISGSDVDIQEIISDYWIELIKEAVMEQM